MAMKTNPKNDWQISDIQSIHKPIKPVYIKQFIELIESMTEEQ